MTGPTPPPAASGFESHSALASGFSTHETILLVSLDDGTVIRQTIDIDADLCFKNNSESSTICLSQGEAIVDSATNRIIGFEMIEDRIDLVAKSD